jgi:hypothetical protein
MLFSHEMAELFLSFYRKKSDTPVKPVFVVLRAFFVGV